MVTVKEKEDAKKRFLFYLKKAKIVITDEEKSRIEITDFGLNRLAEIGLQLITYVNTNRVCAKEMFLFPNQICPEHRHPSIGGKPGKEETFRCRWGIVYLYIPGKPSNKPKAIIPPDLKKYFTVWHEIILNPGEQYTIKENTFHWFQGGSEGAVVSEFSTRSTDEKDIFTDKKIKRIS